MSSPKNIIQLLLILFSDFGLTLLKNYIKKNRIILSILYMDLRGRKQIVPPSVDILLTIEENYLVLFITNQYLKHVFSFKKYTYNIVH